jgi:hypothetical protein
VSGGTVQQNQADQDAELNQARRTLDLINARSFLLFAPV